ncbi:alpha/beta fold hydrolase [Streptomyces atroolivaceus]|uniref:alpha/beta fold hydrolase n=1 Tax=Streptomyces atroolivaceus TaxID=66869 RepID=UPI002024A83A|nr:alpha/beta fold hydrolase [Streptomyces atroolivaceus]
MSTFLLVHGAWHSGRCWERVVPLLESAGHRVFAPSLTGNGDKAHLLGPEVGLDTHVEDVVKLIHEEDLTGVVLVGHSYAGLVVSSVANEVPERIAHLVYLDAMVPEHGETAVDVQPMTQNLIDLAAKSDNGWRIPPMPEMPPPLGLSAGSPTRRTSHGCVRRSPTSRCAACGNRSGWTTPPWTRFRARTSTVSAQSRKASCGGPSPRRSPTAPRHGYGNFRPDTTA